MLSLFATVLDLSYIEKIRLPKLIETLLVVCFTVSIVGLAFLVVKGLCPAQIAIIDISVASTLLILLRKKLK